MTKPGLHLLFVCTGNSARSQMAEGFARSYGSGRVEAASAGTRPAGLHPLAVEAMHEVGIDISAQKSKLLDRKQMTGFDYVITLCDGAREVCPLPPPGVTREHWPIPDPAAASGHRRHRIASFRAARQLIETRIRDLLDRL